MDPETDYEAMVARDFKVYRLKIVLAHVHPPIWRRIEVYAGIELDSLDSAIQTVFGWSGDHMAEFVIKGRRIGDGTDWLVEEDERAAQKRFREKLKLIRKSAISNDALSARQKILDLFSAEIDQAAAPANDAEEPETPALWEMVPRVRTKFSYIYDDWEHSIEVEKIFEPVADGRYPRCVDGARADPIEDCGGPYDHQMLVEAVGDPEHERYSDLEEWGLKKWDPEKFSAEVANRKLAKLSRIKKT